jgi:bis(5'-nucleosyl)-tetraphosphatase (symmetrical)
MNYLVGDVQGCCGALQRLLRAIDFSPSRDRIYLLGDLVNRGRESLATLRLLREFGDAAVCLLGNHDLHLLAVAHGARRLHRNDTFGDVLDAPDRNAWIDWLRQQRMALFEHDWLMVHAGIAPEWDAAMTLALASELEILLRGDGLPEFLHTMYNDEPTRWNAALQGPPRLRFIVNVLTRIRFVAADGTLDLRSKEGAHAAPAGMVPWFEAPGRRGAGTRIAFGHWSTLGLLDRPDLLGLDTGCVWGGRLTAVRWRPARFLSRRLRRRATAGASARGPLDLSCACYHASSPSASGARPMITKTLDCSDVEWDARVRLAACYRVFAQMGWTELIYNHITLRLPGDERHFLINPFGLHYSEVKASNLVKIDLAGRTIGASRWPVNPAGFTVHAAIHAGLPDAHCVMHTHTTAGLAVACSKAGLSMSNFYSAQLHGRIAYHDFEGITVHADEGPRLLRSIGNRPAVILRNHGLLAWGPTLPYTFMLLWTLNRACEIQLASTAMGEVIDIPQAVQRRCTEDALQFRADFGAGQDVLDALTRLVDRSDTSYRE